MITSLAYNILIATYTHYSHSTNNVQLVYLHIYEYDRLSCIFNEFPYAASTLTHSFWLNSIGIGGEALGWSDIRRSLLQFLMVYDALIQIRIFSPCIYEYVKSYITAQPQQKSWVSASSMQEIYGAMFWCF